MLLAIGGFAAFLTTEPWATLLVIGAAYILSFPLSIRSYRRLRTAAEELRTGSPRDDGETTVNEHAAH